VIASVDSAGVAIHYEVTGEGSPLVLVHGLVSSLEATWSRTGWIDFLAAQGHTVVPLDCRGHGLSGKPHDPDAYDGNQMTDDVIAVMDAVGLHACAVMGFSSGGAIAINLLARFPHRLTGAVVVGAGLLLASEAASMIARNEVIAEALLADDVSTITDPAALFFRNLAVSRAQDPQSLAGLDNDLKALSACCGRLLRDLAEVDEDALRRVQVPLLAVIGDRDTVPRTQRLVETVPGAQLVVLPGEDHFSSIRTQACKDTVAAFLRTQRSVSVA
jgi:pimeloyl-ACP methyl ester carboxylesterase